MNHPFLNLYHSYCTSHRLTPNVQSPQLPHLRLNIHYSKLHINEVFRLYYVHIITYIQTYILDNINDKIHDFSYSCIVARE